MQYLSFRHISTINNYQTLLNVHDIYLKPKYIALNCTEICFYLFQLYSEGYIYDTSDKKSVFHP